MGTHAGSVMTLANSIIGVSVLAMPFCFKQCGIVLSIVMLLASSIVSRLACHYLIKAAIMEKRRNFEMLAFRVFGPTGKLMVELCIIGFMVGTCVAYFVVVGDLGPAIMAPILGYEHPTALRPSVLIALGVFVVLPLGLLRNVDSLSTLSAASIAFYSCLVLKVLGEATTHLLAWDWVDKVYYWRPSGFLQCIPIFSMALSCQTQLFEIFDSLPNTPLDRMNAVVKSAINMTTVFYIAVGFFGYIAYCNQSFTGNLMMNFSPTITSDVIKIGFVLSVAVSFPLVIFPCRASLYSLLFSKGHTQPHELSGSAHIPERKFQCITLVIVTGSLVTGLLIPNIELVLGLVGSTIGVFICIVFPAVIFISLSTRNTNERLLAKILVGAGLTIMVLATYTNLQATTKAVSGGPKKIAHSETTPLQLELLNLENNNDRSIAQLPQLASFKEKVVIRDETLKELKDVKELAALAELRKDDMAGIKRAAGVNAAVGAQQQLQGAQSQSQPQPQPQPAELNNNARQEPPVPIDPEAKNIAIVSTGVKNSVERDIESGPKAISRDNLERDKDDSVIEAKIAEPAPEKSIERELIHNKFIDEGKKLLSEIEATRNKGDGDKIEATATVKLINVKTGVVSDLIKSDIATGPDLKSGPAVGKINEDAKIGAEKYIRPLAESLLSKKGDAVRAEESVANGNGSKSSAAAVAAAAVVAAASSSSNSKHDGVNDNPMLKNMARGIPLPVANNKAGVNITDRPANDRSAPLAQPPKREILILKDSKIEERGKRDLEQVEKSDGRPEEPVVVAEDGVKMSPDSNNNNNVAGVPDVKLAGGETAVGEDGRGDSVALGNEPKVEEYREKAGRSFSEMLLDGGEGGEKECADEERKVGARKTDRDGVDRPEAKESSRSEPAEAAGELIRTPSYLSQPKAVLEAVAGVEKSAVAAAALSVESGRPLKRDLKSLRPLPLLNYSADETRLINDNKN